MGDISLKLLKEEFEKFKKKETSLEEFTKFLDLYIPMKIGDAEKQNQEVRDYEGKIIYFKRQIGG